MGFDMFYDFGYDDYGYDYGYGDAPSYAEGVSQSLSLPTCILIGIVIGFAVALIVCLILKRKMNTARIANEASEYMNARELNLTNRQDIFTHTTETRMPIGDGNHGGHGGPHR